MRVSMSSPNMALRQVVERALQVGERDALVDAQSLDLVEHRDVRRVELVGAVHLARGTRRRSAAGGRAWCAPAPARCGCAAPCGARSASTKRVSLVPRAGWSGPRLRASKFSHSPSACGPSAISQPIAMNTSPIRSISAVIGCGAPSGAISTGQGDIDALCHQLLLRARQRRAPRTRGGELLLHGCAGERRAAGRRPCARRREGRRWRGWPARAATSRRCGRVGRPSVPRWTWRRRTQPVRRRPSGPRLAG